MLQNLLVERFGLAFHRETKDLQGYELVVGKTDRSSRNPGSASIRLRLHPRASPSKLETDRNGIPQLPAGRGGVFVGAGPGRNIVSARQQPITELADFLESRFGKPVVDKTGLTAKYDYAFAFDPAGLVGGFNPPAATAPAQQELGLRLDQKKVTVELIVVDRVEKVPTEN